MADHRPILGDPGAESIQGMFDLSEDEPWLLSSWGDFTTFAAETMTNDGGSYQKVVALVLPVRENHTKQTKPLRLMLQPAMARELVADIANALKYIDG